MTKDIYIIKNSVNDMVYIGQSRDVAKRWQGHKYAASYDSHNSNKQPIHIAMSEIGIDKFHYEILEENVENYNDREQYWISFYDSVFPNGYNVQARGTKSFLSVFGSEDDVKRCVSEISSGKKTFHNIAKEYGCCDEVIVSINLGKRYRIDGMEYPLRKSRYENEKLKQIRYSLKYETWMTLEEIAQKYRIDKSQLSLINNGKIYYVHGEKYPIRDKRVQEIDKETLGNIICDILNSDMCLSDIASKYNLNRSVISGINKGNSYNDSSMKYPLRPDKDPRSKSTKKFFDIDQIRDIISMIQSGESINKIAQVYDTSNTTIMNINNGRCKKYVLPEYEYPIRKFVKSPVSTISA